MEIPSYLHKNIIYENPPNVKHGAEAIVFKGTLPFVQGDLAIKQWSDWFREKDEKRRVRREVTILMQNPHDNIIKFLGILVNEESEWIGYVMPYMAMGSLDEIIHNKSKNYDSIYTNEQLNRWIIQICRGLSHLHSKNIIHRDIKPSNVLLGRSYDDVRLSDFGVAKSLERITQTLTKGVGTPLYTAPEIHEEGNYNFSADVYSLSITIWEVLHRRIPYDHIKYSTMFVLCSKICKGVRPQLRNDLSKEVSDLLTRCWDADASKRPEIDKVIEFYDNREYQITTLEKFLTGNTGSKNAQKSTARSKRILNNHEPLYQTPSKKLNFEIPKSVEKSSEKQTILLLGGRDGKDKNSLLMLENNEQNWKELNIKLPYAIINHGAQFLNNNLYIFGGHNEKLGNLNWTYKLSESLEWMKMTDMNQTRRDISNSSVILNNQIWVCGGENEKYYALRNVEMYDPETNKWKYMKQMNQWRRNAAAAVVNGKIFCSGGFFERSVECYDSSSDVWTIISILPQNMCAYGAVEMYENLIIVGECDDYESLNYVWALNTTDENSEWIEKPSISTSREWFSIAKIDGKIFVCGGQVRIFSITDSVEIFDGEVWRNGPKMSISRDSAPAVVIPIEFARSLN